MSPTTLLQKLLYARGPAGQEGEVRKLCQELLSPLCDRVWTDAAGNVIGHIQGSDSSRSAVRVLVHMDEISLIVKRVSEEGHLRVDPLGGLFPFITGQGLVEVMGHQMIPGVLSHGSVHVTSESEKMHKQRSKETGGKGESGGWEDLYVVTRKSKQELRGLGIHAGTRVVIAKERRTVQKVGDCLAGYFMDNRAAITAALLAFEGLQQGRSSLKGDLYFVATTGEEIGGLGASYAARQLPGDVTVAVDVAPVAKEYEIELSPAPVVFYRDSLSVYDKEFADQLLQLGTGLEMAPQAAVCSRYGSDASIVHSKGLTARSALIGIPTENTHGMELIHEEGIVQAAQLLQAFLMQHQR